MKTLETQTPAAQEISAEKIAELKLKISEKWDDFYTKIELCTNIEMGYIFGPYAQSEHYSKDFLMGLIDAVDLEKNPPPVVEQTFEEAMNDVEAGIITEEPTI